MCGRYTLTASVRGASKKDHFGTHLPRLSAHDWQPRYSIAPAQFAPVIVLENGAPAIKQMKWGLIPSWSQEIPRSGAKLTNARSETAAEKPSFRDALRKRRYPRVERPGLYEWKKNGKAQDALLHPGRRRQALVAFARLLGVVALTRRAGALETFTIPHESGARLHGNRPSRADAWSSWPRPRIQPSLAPRGGRWRASEVPSLRAHPVSTHVNSAQFDDPSCVVPAEKAPAPGKPDGGARRKGCSTSVPTARELLFSFVCEASSFARF